MELKCMKLQFLQLSLICSNRTFMELKSDFWLGNLPPESSSNRTFMELK